MTDGRSTTPGTEADSHLSALAVCLKAHGFDVELTTRGLVVSNPEADACCPDAGRRHLADTITCRPYEADGGRAWFFTSWQQPIAEADRITDALIAIKGYLAGRA